MEYIIIWGYNVDDNIIIMMYVQSGVAIEMLF